MSFLQPFSFAHMRIGASSPQAIAEMDDRVIVNGSTRDVTNGDVESGGITVLGGPNIEGRSALLTMAYAAARASRLQLLRNGSATLSPSTGPDHAGTHAELARCARRGLIGENGSVRFTVSATEPASTGTPLLMPVDRVGLTRHNGGFDVRAAGTIQNLWKLLQKSAGSTRERNREWAIEWLAEIARGAQEQLDRLR